MKRKIQTTLLVLSLLALPPLFPISMNPRVRSVSKELQEQVFVTPEETLPKLTAALVSGVGDTATKVRILHDWICDNIAYDCDVFTQLGAGPQNHAAVLQKKKAICYGYSNLMYVMCRYAGIEADIVSGWSKGFNYPGYLWDESDHAWNAIKIGNRWQLVDVTWDAGYVEGATFIKHYSTEWLNRRPEEFIYSHLPEEEKWQLLKDPRSPEQFVKEPYIEGKFFDYGFSLGKHAPDYTNYIEEATMFDIVQAGAVSPILCDLYGKKMVDYAVLLETYGNRTELTVDVPDRGSYRARFFVKKKDAGRPNDYFSVSDFEQRLLPKATELLDQKKISQKEFDCLEPSFRKVEDNGRYYFAEDLFDGPRTNAVLKIIRLAEMDGSGYEKILAFEVRAAEGYDGFGSGMRFPIVYQYLRAVRATHLVAPLQGTVQKGSVQKFALKSSDFSKFAVIEGGNNFVFFAKNPKTGDFELEYTVPQEGDSVFVFGSKDGRNFATLMEFRAE